MQYATEIKTENLICLASFKKQKITVILLFTADLKQQNGPCQVLKSYNGNNFWNFRLDQIRCHVILSCHIFLFGGGEYRNWGKDGL